MIFERDEDIPDYFGKVYLIIDQAKDESYTYSFGAYIADSDILDSKDSFSFEIIDADLTNEEQSYVESLFPSIGKIRADINVSLAAYEQPSLNGLVIHEEGLYGFDYHVLLKTLNKSKTIRIDIENVLNPNSAFIMNVDNMAAA